MRVLHVLPTRVIEYGGPVVVAEQIVAELQHRGIEAEIHPAAGSGPNSPVWNALTLSRDSAKLRQCVARSDLVHIHGLWNLPATVAARAAAKARIPYVITAHGMLDRWARQRSRFKKVAYGVLFERRNLAHAAALHFFNTEEEAEAREYLGGHRAFIIPNGVRAETYAGLALRRSTPAHDGNAGEVRALFLGRLHPKKGLDLLLPAFAEAVKSVPRLQLAVAGPGEQEYQRHLCDLTTRLGLEGNVSFLGLVQGREKLEALAAADFFVLPSYQEGDSIALKEALASGLPAIITAACHFPDVAEFNAGRIVRPQVMELAQALCSLAQRSEERILMARNAVELIREQYSWGHIVDRLVNVYRDIATQTETSPDWVS